MKKSKSQIGWCVFLVSFSLILIGAGVFLWFGFYKFYDKIIDESIILQEDENGQLSKSTFWFAHPPVDAISNYYMFDVLNPAGVEFFGQKPSVEQIGPFAVRDVTNKKDHSFNEDGTRMTYKDYITFIFDRKNSCLDCDYDRLITLPNLVAIGTVEELLDPMNNVSSMEIQLIDFFMLLVGEYPFIQVKWGAFIFDGYEDALLSAAHSQLVYDLNELNGGKSIIPVTVPDMKTMALFLHYNNTNDEEYEVHTGRDDLSKVGRLVKWANRDKLPESWWTDERAQQLRGSETGGFQTPRLQKDTRVELFYSYLCRSFDLEFTGEENVGEIMTYKYEGGEENFDTTRPEQAGFRYSNSEVINYYPDWPSCLNSTTPPPSNCTAEQVDCSGVENMCNPCCTGSYMNGTFQLPPGMYPINCFPGRVKEAPFRLLFTTPHFSLSPPEVRNSIDGLGELAENKYPFNFKYIPRTGSCLEANIRFQIAIPIYQTPLSIMCSHFPNKIFPVLWVDNHVKMGKTAYDQFRTGLVVVPRVVNVLKYVLPAVGVLLFVIGIGIFLVKSGSLDISTAHSKL